MFIQKKLIYPIYGLLLIVVVCLGALATEYMQEFYRDYFKSVVPIEITENLDHAQYLQLSKKYLSEHDYERAIAYGKKATALMPNDIATLQTAGQAYLMASELDAALAMHNKVLELMPESHRSHYNVGYIHARAGELLKACHAFNTAIQLKPDYQMAYTMRGETLLKLGQFEQGMQDFAWHWKKKFMPGCWDSINFHGKTVLLCDVQAHGDSIHFIRYLQILKQRGAKTVLYTLSKALIPLYSRCDYIDQIIVEDDAIPHHDYQAPLMALFVIFGKHVESIPNKVPYLTADQKLVQFWKDKISSDKNIKVAISWHADQQCELTKPINERKSIPLKLFYDMFRIPGVSFYSLQKFDGVEELADVSSDIIIHHFDQDFDGTHGRFMDTAALIENMDVVISVDTSIAHLAGALGKPTWMILNFPGDWRWFPMTDSTVFYPTMKIFKKPSPTDWASVAKNMEIELRKMVKTKR